MRAEITQSLVTAHFKDTHKVWLLFIRLEWLSNIKRKKIWICYSWKEISQFQYFYLVILDILLYCCLTLHLWSWSTRCKTYWDVFRAGIKPSSELHFLFTRELPLRRTKLTSCPRNHLHLIREWDRGHICWKSVILSSQNIANVTV